MKPRDSKDDHEVPTNTESDEIQIIHVDPDLVSTDERGADPELRADEALKSHVDFGDSADAVEFE